MLDTAREQRQRNTDSITQSINSPVQLRERLQENPYFLPCIKDLVSLTKNLDPYQRIQFLYDYFPNENEILTREYIHALAQYLVKRAEEIQKATSVNHRNPFILEVAAGTGKLTASLEAAMNNKSDIILQATDSGEEHRPSIRPGLVEKINYEDALKTHSPDIVICSWMPPGVDWTEAFRNKLSVQEYILIGEVGGGACGDDWKTWGFDPRNTHANLRPMYETDGFIKTPLNDLSALQRELGLTQSLTISFRRDLQK